MFRNMINLNRILAVLAIAGIFGGVYMFILDQKASPVSQPISPPAVPPYKSFISGAGIVEAASENISLGAMVGAVVVKVLVKKGDIVPKGTVLFTLDSRQAVANLEVQKALLVQAKDALEQARANLKYAQDELDLITHLTDQRGVTKEEIITRQDNVVIANAGVETARASVEVAHSQANEAQVVLDFYTVKAPLDCEIMQINIHPGEFANVSQQINPSSTQLITPLMLIGDVSRYHVRVDVDENDAWRFKKTEPAVAFLRGNVEYHTDLKFEYIEPYVIPKASLTGDPTERVDTRVLQVVYSYDPKALPAYLGQEVDVYIKAEQLSSSVKYGGPLPVSR